MATWLTINRDALVSVVAFGWLWLLPVLLVEQFLYYTYAYWLFDLEPPLDRRDQHNS